MNTINTVSRKIKHLFFIIFADTYLSMASVVKLVSYHLCRGNLNKFKKIKDGNMHKKMNTEMNAQKPHKKPYKHAHLW